MSETAPSSRIVSMDQFRGYTVAGMFLVNFLGGLMAIPRGVQASQPPYFSYADTIMPSFMFAGGFSYRLSRPAPARKIGTIADLPHVVVRSLAWSWSRW